MIKRELEKNPDLKNENWERFLPNFKKRNVQRKTKKVEKKKSKDVFPPLPTPRKEDLMMESGEYFMNQEDRKRKQHIEKVEESKMRSAQRKKEKEKMYQPPAEDAAPKKAKKEKTTESATQMAERLASKVSSSAEKPKKKKTELLIN